MSFIPIYIIEMPGSKRVELIKLQLRLLDLPFKSQEAILGKYLTKNKMTKIYYVEKLQITRLY